MASEQTQRAILPAHRANLPVHYSNFLEKCKNKGQWGTSTAKMQSKWQNSTLDGQFCPDSGLISP